VIDNTEHLLDSATHLVDALLVSCPHLRVLATSREALRIPGEVNWAVPTLSVPDSLSASTVEELETYESARLFAERAHRRDRSFALSTASAGAVAKICRRLDGIPLAIELAAAWVSVLSIEQIAARLSDSLDLLRSGDRTATPRQRTIEGALNWSYGLLSDGEKVLFGRSAVFMGGWTLEAVEAVGSGMGVDEDDVPDLIFGLAEKSLVMVEAAGDDTVRYRLLEPVRQYALAKLDKNGGLEAARRRHAEYFLGVAEEAETLWWTAEEAEWMNLLEEDHDNLRAALSWSLEHGEAETALRLSGALPAFWGARGHSREGVSWLERALDVGGGASPAGRGPWPYWAWATSCGVGVWSGRKHTSKRHSGCTSRSEIGGERPRPCAYWVGCRVIEATRCGPGPYSREAWHYSENRGTVVSCPLSSEPWHTWRSTQETSSGQWVCGRNPWH
jgi:predicted ATPase